MKTETLLTSILLLSLFIALTVYAQSYVTTILADASVDASTKALVRFVPTLMGVGIIAFAGGIIWTGAKSR